MPKEGTRDPADPTRVPEEAASEEGDELIDHWRDILGPRPESVEKRLIRTLGLPQPGTLSICREDGSIIAAICSDGKIVYGPGYTPDEAAEVFWTNMALKKKGMDARLQELSIMETMLIRLGRADFRYEQASIAAQAEGAGEPERTAQERCRMYLESLVHQLIEHSRGVALQYAHEPEAASPPVAPPPGPAAAPQAAPRRIIEGAPDCPECRGRGLVLQDHGNPDVSMFFDLCPRCHPTPTLTHGVSR
jgi:hypothetical protein